MSAPYRSHLCSALLLACMGALLFPYTAGAQYGCFENYCRCDTVSGALLSCSFPNPTAITSLSSSPVDGKLASLPAGVFDQLTALESLDLSGNLLASLPAGIFDKQTGMKRLNLAHNQLTSLSPGIFDNLKKLNFLDISYNNLTSLPLGVFDSQDLFLLANNNPGSKGYLCNAPMA
eukprot:Opistho-2@76745